MKNVVILIILIAGINLSAQEVAQFSESNYRQSSVEAKVNPLEFFETLVNPDQFHPANKRNPEWQKHNLTHLTLDPLPKKLSLTEFKELLTKGSWRNLYHCEAAPVTTIKNIGDGKGNHGYLERDYDEDNLTRVLTDKPNSKVRRAKFDDTKYSIEAVSDGKFKITYENLLAEEVTVVYIKEADTPALVLKSKLPSSIISYKPAKLCPNGEIYQNLLVRTDLPTM